MNNNIYQPQTMIKSAIEDPLRIQQSFVTEWAAHFKESMQNNFPAFNNNAEEYKKHVWR